MLAPGCLRYTFGAPYNDYHNQWAAQVSTQLPEHEKENSTHPALNTNRWGSQPGSHQGGSVHAADKCRWCSLAAAQTTFQSQCCAEECPFCTRHLAAPLRTLRLSPLPGLGAWCQPSLQEMQRSYTLATHEEIIVNMQKITNNIMDNRIHVLASRKNMYNTCHGATLNLSPHSVTSTAEIHIYL